MADLIIRISGDISDYEKALEDAQGQTEGLGGKLETVAKSAGIAFALLTAEALASVSAFASSQAASNSLIQSLQQQGIYTKELADEYRDIASAIQAKTGADDDEVVSAMASAQNMLGQTKITQELAMSVSDLAQAKGIDLKSAYDLVAKAATVNTSVLKRQGIEVEDTGDKTKNLIAIQEALSQKFGGQAEAAAKGLGGIKLLKNTFGDLQEEIGKRLAPAFEVLIQKTTQVLQFIQANKGLVDFIVSIGVAGAAVSGIALAVAAGGLAFLKLKAALMAAQVATSAMTIATRGLVAATGIGLLITVATLVALNWDAVWPRLQGVFQAFVVSVSEMASGLGKILKGVFTMDTAQIEEGFAQARAAASRGIAAYNTTVDAGIAQRQAAEDKEEAEKVAKNNANAAAEEARERQKAARIAEIAAEKRALVVAQLDQESEESVKLRQEEIALLEQIEDEKNAAIVGKLQERLARVRELQVLQQEEDMAAQQTFQSQMLANNEEFQALSDEQKALFLEKNKGQLQAEIMTENEVRQKAALDRAQIQVKEHNDFLLNQQKFGTAYATINRIMHSEAVQGAARAFGDLAALQTSSNATLKGIGKAAALANIAIQTATSAMNIYSGFSTIPIIGPALGVAGAVAAVAFGAEQAGKVTSAAQGGLMTGGIPGVDSIPTLTMPGELVAPTRNFDEVVNAVADSRLAESGLGSVGGGGGSATIILQLKDELMDFIEARLVERTNLNLSIQGV